MGTNYRIDPYFVLKFGSETILLVFKLLMSVNSFLLLYLVYLGVSVLKRLHSIRLIKIYGRGRGEKGGCLLDSRAIFAYWEKNLHAAPEYSFNSSLS